VVGGSKKILNLKIMFRKQKLAVMVPTLAAVAGVLAVASPASADINYTSQISTSTALVGAISADLLQTTVYSIGAVLGIAVLMVAVGFAWRKLTQKVTGRKF